jgi:hypothetical protein
VLRRFAPVMVVMVALLAACQGAAAISDPTEIITQGLDATAKLHSFHVSVALSGTVTMPGSGGSVKLDSTSAGADVDIPGRQAHLTFSVPAFLSLSGEVIAIGEDVWVKTSMTGAKWSHQTNPMSGASMAPATSGEPMASFDTATMIAKVKEFLAKDGVVVKKLADVACGDRDCYQVSVSIPSSLMNDAGAMASMSPSTVFGDALVLNLLFDRQSLWLTEVSTDIASDTVGTVSATVRLSKFDEAVTVSPPPAADVTEGPITLPGLPSGLPGM